MKMITARRGFVDGKRRLLARYLIGAALGVATTALAAGPAAPAETRPAATRPAGFSVFAAEPVDEIADDTAPDPAKPLGLKLVAPRNGTSSDLVVACDQGPIKGLKATLGPMKLKDGTAVLPAKALQIRYAAREGAKNRYRPDNGNRGAGGRMFYDDLWEVAPTSDPTLPIWLTVNTAPDAVPGEYVGTLSVTGPDGQTTAVPASVVVSPWKAPDPKDFLSHVGLIESPESVALKYKVPLWSERHFALIGEVFGYLGQIGNKVLTVSAIANTQLGNYQSMIRLAKSGGKTEVDFSILDRYLALYAKTNAPPDVFYIYVWDKWDQDKAGKYAPISVSVVDKATGGVSSQSFTYDSPEGKAYFKAVMDGVKARVKKLGWKPECVMYGVASDARPSPTTVEIFNTLSPGTKWILNTHFWAKEIHGVEVGYAAWCRVRPPEYKAPGWSNPLLEVQFMRDKHDRETGPLTWRYIVEDSLAAGHRGEGRIGADFWHVMLPGETQEREMDNRGGGAMGWSGNLMLNCSSCAMLAPGPSGPVSTARFEMLRESLQDCEARIVLEKALMDESAKAKLGAELVKRCTEELARRKGMFGKRRDPAKAAATAAASWHDLSETLFKLAAEVEAKR